MTQRTKVATMLLLAVTLLSLVLLSSSLSNLELQAGVPFPSVDSHYAVESSVAQHNRYTLPTVFQAILKLILLLLMIYVPVRLILLVKLKWIFRLIQILAVLLVIVFALMLVKLEPASGVLETSNLVTSGQEISRLGKPPQGFVYLVVISFILIAGFFIATIIAHQSRRARSDGALLKEAESAMEAIEAGGDFKNVIVRCYMQMAEALQREYGIERSQHLTPREFEDLLEFKGFPSHPIRELTDLFEKVRYGRQQLSPGDEKQAMDSLRAIVGFVKGTLHD